MRCESKMKIKLAILEKDQGYLTKIVSVFSTKYADKFEIYSFTDKEVALAHLEEAKNKVKGNIMSNDILLLRKKK